MKLSRAVLLVAGIVAIGGGVAVVATRNTPSTEGPPAMGEIHPVASSWEISLPFNEYRHTTAELNTIELAAALIAKDCMRRFGRDWPSPTADAADPSLPADGRRYGVLDLVEVSRQGYHPPEEKPRQDDGGRAQPPLDDVMVYTGKGAATLRGQAIPDGGCLGEARRKLAEGVPPSMSGAQFADLDLQLFAAAQSDGRVRAAMMRWRECMAESGYDYTDVWAANNDVRWSGDLSSPEEITTAKADVACRTRVNLVPIWLAVETAYQRRAVAERADDFAALKGGMRVRLDNALRVTSTQ